MKKIIEIVKQLFGLGSTAKSITTASQLNNEIKESIIEVGEKVEEIKAKVKKRKKKPSKPKTVVTPEPIVVEKQKKVKKPKEQ